MRVELDRLPYFMATDKKGFILYADQISLFEALTDYEAGQLIKYIFKYITDQDPIQSDNRIVEMAFIPIKLQLKRDLKIWESKIKQRSEAGKASALSRSTKSTSVKSRSTKSTVIVSVNDNVNVKDNVSVNQLAQWFKDFPNSSDLEDFARTSKYDIEQLKLKVEEFKKYAEITYPTYSKFVFHFKRWLLKNPITVKKSAKELL